VGLKSKCLLDPFTHLVSNKRQFMKQKSLPYFDYIFKQIEEGGDERTQAINKHVHWGYWDSPSAATLTVEDYVQAQERLNHQLFELASLSNGSSILDVGCGLGGTISLLNDMLANAKLTGLNIDPRQLDYARQTVTPCSNNEITFIEGDACQLPFADNQFDQVFAVECIFHFSSRKQFFAEVKRVLKEDGKLVISDYVPYWFLRPMGALMSSRRFEQYSPYGYTNMNITLGSYRRLAKANQMRMIGKNVSVNVQPTYDFLEKHYIDHYVDEMQLPKKMKDELRWFSSIAKLNHFRYYLMVFQPCDKTNNGF